MADIKAIMQRQYGPMPVWAWTALGGSVIAAYVVFSKKKKGTTVPAGSGTGKTVDTSGQGFQSGISTTTTDAQGNQVTTNYSASGPNSYLPGQILSAGQMPYQSGGDVYVNYPSNPTTPTPPPPPQQTTVPIRQQLDVAKFNVNSQGGPNTNSPWFMTVAQPGESWQDITSRIYNFGPNFASVTDPAAIKRINEVWPYIKDSNNHPGNTSNEPTPGYVIFYR